jgi:hypothetical protein
MKILKQISWAKISAHRNISTLYAGKFEMIHYSIIMHSIILLMKSNMKQSGSIFQIVITICLWILKTI